MSSYITLYDRITKMMGIEELIYLTTLEPTGYTVTGLYVYYRLVTSVNYCNKKNIAYLECDCDYQKSDKKINDHIYKFKMDEHGNVFTTPTGAVFLFHYILLEYPDTDIRGCLSKYIYRRTLCLEPQNLFYKKDISILFHIKKKFNLPRPIICLIALEICKLHFKRSDKYICLDCGIQSFKKYCPQHKLDHKCSLCGKIKKRVHECRKCHDLYCNNCFGWSSYTTCKNCL
jgi:hypothetical protein